MGKSVQAASIRMFDFGDKAAVMLSLHDPYGGGKPYYNVRLWILRDNLWQLAASQQTTIASAVPVPPIHGSDVRRVCDWSRSSDSAIKVHLFLD